MKSPIKFNDENLHGFLKKILPTAKDLRRILNPENLTREQFSEYITYFYNGENIFKSTKPNRHKLSNLKIIEEIKSFKDPVIVDIGASDGSTSLDLIEGLGSAFKKYYVTDICFSAYTLEQNGNTYFYDPLSGKCRAVVSDKFIFYFDKYASVLPLRWFSNKKTSNAPEFLPGKMNKVSLCQPDLLALIRKNSEKILLKEWDVMKGWQLEKADIVKAANVLNREFFSNQLLIKALKNIKCMLKENARLLIVENRKIEQWSIYKLVNEKFQEIASGNGGSDIKDLVEIV